MLSIEASAAMRATARACQVPGPISEFPNGITQGLGFTQSFGIGVCKDFIGVIYGVCRDYKGILGTSLGLFRDM